MPLPRLSPPSLPTWSDLDGPAPVPDALRHRLLRPVAVPLVGAVAAGLTTLAPAAPAQAARWPGHPDRSLVVHTVQKGDTATGLAVRYHAWTRELLSLNRLTTTTPLRVGQKLRIPVVVSAARRAAPEKKPKAAAAKARAAKAARAKGPSLQQRVYRSTTWKRAGMSRAQVRTLIVRTARANGVPPRLALAVAWQESGWQQKLVSSAGAVGVMQVLPSTGEWMEQYAGRPLQIGDTRDNVLAGVLTLEVLRANTRLDNRAIAAYYQGLGAVREHGVYPSSKVYVANVRAHQARITRTGSPTA